MDDWLILIVILVPIIAFLIWNTRSFLKETNVSTRAATAASLAFLYFFVGRQVVYKVFICDFGESISIAQQRLGFWKSAIVDSPTYVLAFLPTRYHIQARRRKQTHRDWTASSVRQSGKKFALYLRPFDITNKLPVTVNDTHLTTFGLVAEEDFETLLAEAFDGELGIVALGRPGEAFGAGRVQVDEELWKNEVADMMREAALIVLVPEIRAGTLWEIEHIVANKYIAKTIWVRPPHFKHEAWDKITEVMLADHHLQISQFSMFGVRSSVVTGGAFVLDVDGRVRASCIFRPDPTPHDIRATIDDVVARSCTGQILNERTSETNQVQRAELQEQAADRTPKQNPIITCPLCGNKVIRMTNGKCPACRRSLRLHVAE